MTITIRRGVEVQPPIMFLYAYEKVGKSSFAAGLEFDKDGKAIGVVEGHKPLFIVTNRENEQIGMDRTDPLTSTREIHDALVYAAEDKEHNVIVVDHFSDVERIIHTEVAAGWDPPAPSIAMIGYGKGYGAAMKWWEALWTDVERVRNSGKCVILIAHAHAHKYEPPDADGYDVFSPGLHVNARGEGAGKFWRDKVDIVAFAQKEAFTRTTGEGFNKKNKAVGGGRRLLHLASNTPAYVAGNRYGLPATIDLSWQAFLDAMAAATSAKAKGRAAE